MHLNFFKFSCLLPWDIAPSHLDHGPSDLFLLDTILSLFLIVKEIYTHIIQLSFGECLTWVRLQQLQKCSAVWSYLLMQCFNNRDVTGNSLSILRSQPGQLPLLLFDFQLARDVWHAWPEVQVSGMRFVPTWAIGHWEWFFLQYNAEIGLSLGKPWELSAG